MALVFWGQVGEEGGVPSEGGHTLSSLLTIPATVNSRFDFLKAISLQPGNDNDRGDSNNSRWHY